MKKKNKQAAMIHASDELIQEVGDEARNAYNIDETEVQDLLSDNDTPPILLKNDGFDLDNDECQVCSTPREDGECPYGCEE